MELVAISTQDFEKLLNEVVSLRETLLTFRAPAPPPIPETGGIALAESVLGRSKSWIYKMTSQNRLPHRKFNKSLVFHRSELLEYLEKNIVELNDIDPGVDEAITASANKKLKNDFERNR